MSRKTIKEIRTSIRISIVLFTFLLYFLPHHHLLSFKGVIPRIYDLSFGLSINRVMLLVHKLINGIVAKGWKWKVLSGFNQP